jgi:uncharacterized protein YkwD
MKVYFIALCLVSVSCARMRSSISDPYTPVVQSGVIINQNNPNAQTGQTTNTPNTQTQASPYGMAPGFTSLPTQYQPAAPAQPTTTHLTPSSVPSSGSVSDLKLSCQEARFVDLLNMYRQQNNLNRVAVSKAGVVSARWHTQDMISQNYFSHSEPNGRSFNSRAASFGYSAWAENIAAGSTTAEGVFCQWKNSPGHNSNMLGAHQTIGIGMSSGGGTYGVYWENSFGSSTSDTLSSPLTADGGCQMPAQLPGC